MACIMAIRGGVELEINSREESGRNLNQQRMLFLSCPNASFAVVVFLASWREAPLGWGFAIAAAETDTACAAGF